MVVSFGLLGVKRLNIRSAAMIRYFADLKTKRVWGIHKLRTGCKV
jgi:hypothetical protein